MPTEQTQPVTEREIRMRWLAAGVIFGALFPIIGWYMASGADGVHGLEAAHRAQPVLYIVDLAPLVLGLTGLGIGVFHSRLVRIRHSIEETVLLRTQDLRAALDELSSAQAELLNSQKLEAIGGLAAGIAHEINTPIQYVGDNTRFVDESLSGLLNVANAAAQLASAVGHMHEVASLVAAYQSAADDADVEFLAAEIPTAISESLDGIEQVASIVKALKSFAHPGDDVKAPTDLNEMVTSTVAVARNEWRYVADMDLSGLDPNLPHVPVLSGPLKQVLLNMIVNAAQAVEGGVAGADVKGTIAIASRLVGDTAELEIADSGGGIPADIQDRVFEPFFTTKDVGQGSGQGLAIAQSIVAKHDGVLSFVSTPGEGTVFTITLPMEQKSEAGSQKSEDELLAAGS